MTRKCPSRATLAAAIGAALFSLPAAAQQLTLMTGSKHGFLVYASFGYDF